MPRLLPSRDASALEATLSGSIGPTLANRALLDIAGELRAAGLTSPTPIAAPERREELRQAVLAQRAAARSVGVGARARGAVIGVAVVAGAGLVVASAATSSNPAVFVAFVARELPGLDLRPEPRASIAIEGEVVGSHDGGRTLEVRSAPNTIVFVEAPQDVRSVTSGGTTVPVTRIADGSTVRVTTDRAPEAGVVPAKKIEVLPSAADVSVPSAANPPAYAKTPPANSSGLAPVPTVRPDPTRTPTASPSPKPVHTNVAIVTALDPVPTEPATPKPDPKRTPASDTTNNDPANETRSVADSAPAPAIAD